MKKGIISLLICVLLFNNMVYAETNGVFIARTHKSLTVSALDDQGISDNTEQYRLTVNKDAGVSSVTVKVGSVVVPPATQSDSANVYWIDKDNTADVTAEYKNGYMPKSGTGRTGVISDAKTVNITTIDKYNIVFDFKGGTDESTTNPKRMANITNTSYASTTLPVSTLRKTNYAFKGWDTSSAASTVVYKDGETLKTPQITNETLKLYAVWEEYKDVSYDEGKVLAIPGIYYTDDYEVASLRNTLMYTWDELEDFGMDIEKDYERLKNGATLNLSTTTIQSISSTYKSAAAVLQRTPIPGTNKRIIGQIVFPKDIKKIGSFQFFHACALKGQITIPDGTEYIGQSVFDAAFYDRTTAINADLIIPDSVKMIGATAFWGCPYNGTLKIGKGVWGIAGEAFAIAKFTNIEIPSNVKYIGTYAFESNSNIKSISSLKSVQYVASDAFYGCGSSVTSLLSLPTNVQEFTIPSGTTHVPNSMFGTASFNADHHPNPNPSTLKSVIIPNTVKKLGDEYSLSSYAAFNYCKSLTSITIPNSVTYIGAYTFYQCTSLSNLAFDGTKAQWNQISKGSGWNSGVPAKTVKCTDGNVNL